MSSSASSKPQEFSGIRGIFWPIYNYELKKFMPMGFMMLCILFNYTLLRQIKDALVMLAPAGGAETISFLKLYGVTPSAFLFMILFVKLAHMMSRENLFYSIVSSFLIFFGAFAFIIYPNRELFHMSLETMKSMQAAFPSLHWFIPVVGNWSFSLFYILAELWGSVVLSMLFWQFANEICRISEAKRFYGMFGLIGNFGLVLCGQVMIQASALAQGLVGNDEGADAWGLNLKFQMSLVVLAGLVVLGLYYWMNRSVLTDPRFYDPEEVGGGKKKKPKMSLGQSLKYVASSPYLIMIAILVIAYGVSINLVEGVWKAQVKLAFPNHNDYIQYMGNFVTYTGLATITMMIVGNNILRRLSWLTAAILTPLMILVTSALFFSFVLFANEGGDPFAAFMGTTVVLFTCLVGLFQNVMSKATKYSLFDSTKNMAYIPLDQELKVSGQAAVEVLGGRAGKSGGAFIQSTLLMLMGGATTLTSLVHILGPTVIVICLMWCAAVINLNKRFLAITSDKTK